MSARIAVSLLGQRRFVPLLGATTLGAFNDNMFKMALVVGASAGLLTFGDMPAGALAPMAANAFTAAIFLFSAVAGQVADRYDRAEILKKTKLAEIGLMTLAAFGFYTMNSLVLLATLFLMGVQSAFYSPARVASLPHYLGAKELVPGNALIGGSLFMAILVGGALGTLLIPTGNGRFIIGGVLVGGAILGWLVILATPPSPSAKNPKPVNWNFVTETWRMIALVLKTPGMARPLLAAAWFWAIAAAVVTLLHTVVQDVLGQDQMLTAAMQVLFTVGAAVGSISCGLFARGEDASAFSVAGAIGVVVFAGDLAWQLLHWQTGPAVGVAAFVQDPAHWRILVDFFLAAMFAGLYVVPQQALAQRRAPEDIRARLLAGGNLLNAAAATGAQLLLMLNAWAGGSPALVFALVGTGSAVVAAIILRRLMQQSRSATAGQP